MISWPCSALWRAAFSFVALVCVVLVVPRFARAQDADERPALVEFHFRPTGYAQLAVWIEGAAGEFLATVGLTEAVALRGIGNRPGASQMNSGFRWPYGRREGVLPVWARKRASEPSARLFRRVIFQNRLSEGLASRSVHDYSGDDYFCLSFDNARSQRDALDAVSCASVFSSDKGRFLTEEDVAAAYAEPYEDVLTKEGRMQPLSLGSLYPPRRDVRPCTGSCFDHSDVADFARHAKEVMPEIDTVTMATPKGDEPKRLIFSVPPDWGEGEYRACLEINVEGDYNAHYDPTSYPTPQTPLHEWDSWAMTYGYPYRGQPSVVYCVPFLLGEQARATYATAAPEGGIDGWDTASQDYGELTGLDHMTDDPQSAPGSGADRLLRDEHGQRLRVVVRSPLECKDDTAPAPVSHLRLARHGDELHAHQWSVLSFRAADDDGGVFLYEVRVSIEPIVDEESFMRGEPAKSATLEADGLIVPVQVAPGELISVGLGGLVAETHYYVGVRAIDGCAQASPIEVAQITTPKRVFATVTPCFVATAAYGSPLAREIGVLRRLRDRHIASNALGRAAVSVYEAVGPGLARWISESEERRAVARSLLSPIVRFARMIVDD